MMPQFTLGARRVRLDFKPSSNTAVDRIKRAGAALIDAVNDEAGEKWWSETSAQQCRSGSIKANIGWRH